MQRNDTEGYVETCEINNFEELTNGQISIICPDIYFYSTVSECAYYSRITGGFTFPFPSDSNPQPFTFGTFNTQDTLTIQNDGDETGFTLEITAKSTSEIAAKNVTLYNSKTNEYIQISGDVLNGDTIRITTKTGNKTVTLVRGGEKFNIINRLVSGSTWLTLHEGKNSFYLKGTGINNLTVKIIHTNAYLGV